MEDEPLTWDRTHEWVVRRVYGSRCRISAIIKPEEIARQLAAVRRVWGEYKNMPPGEVRRQIKDGKILLGVFNSIESQVIKQLANELNLPLEIRDASTVSYVPIDKTINVIMHIDDDSEAVRIASEMIAAGARLEHVEID